MSFSDAIHELALLRLCPVCKKRSVQCKDWMACYEEWVYKSSSGRRTCPLCRTQPTSRVALHAGMCCGGFGRALQQMKRSHGLGYGRDASPTPEDPQPSTSREQQVAPPERARNIITRRRNVEDKKEKGVNTSPPRTKDKGVNTSPIVIFPGEETPFLADYTARPTGVFPKVKRNVYARLNALRREIELILGPDGDDLIRFDEEEPQPLALATADAENQDPMANVPPIIDITSSDEDDLIRFDEEEPQPLALATAVAENQEPTADETSHNAPPVTEERPQPLALATAAAETQEPTADEAAHNTPPVIDEVLNTANDPLADQPDLQPTPRGLTEDEQIHVQELLNAYTAGW